MMSSFTTHTPVTKAWISHSQLGTVARWQSVCECGWKGAARMSKFMASEDGVKHAFRKGPNAVRQVGAS
jgi:hypothetical protein